MSLLIALVPMIAWGSIGLVSGKIGGSANQQTLGMTIGALLFSIVVFCHPAYVDDSHINCWIYIWFILEFGTESTIS